MADGWSFSLHPFSVDLLPLLLDPESECVFVRGHRPEPRVVWWETGVQFSRGTPAEPCRVRNLVLDLQMSLAVFLRRRNCFRESGLECYQAREPVPDTFAASGPIRRKSLIRAGVRTGLYLPAPGDVAIFWAVERGVFERARGHPEVRSLILESP